MKISTGNYEVLYSSWTPSYRMNDVVIELAENPELTIRISVRRDDVLGEPDVQLDFKKARQLSITIINPHKLSHMGSPEPVEVGKIQGKNLLFSFRVDMFGNYHSFAVTYAFLLGG